MDGNVKDLVPPQDLNQGRIQDQNQGADQRVGLGGKENQDQDIGTGNQGILIRHRKSRKRH